MQRHYPANKSKESKDQRSGIYRWKETAGLIHERRHVHPTDSIEVVLLTIVIDVSEDRDVTVTDTLGAYLTKDINEEVYIIL